MHFDALELVQSTPDPTLLVNTDGRIIAGNQAAARLADTSIAGLADAPTSLVFQDSPEKVLCYLAHCARTREASPGGMTWRNQAGGGTEMQCEGALLRARSADAPAVVVLHFRAKEDACDRFIA